MVVDPITITPEKLIGEAFALMKNNQISGIPVVNNFSSKIEGILTNRDIRFAENKNEKVENFMTKKVVTVKKNNKNEQPKRLLHLYRIEKLVVVDNNEKCIGLITVKDIEKSEKFPLSTKDKHGRLLVGAATGVGKEGLKRSEALIESGVDLLVVDTAHGHNSKVLESIKYISKKYSNLSILAGNVATPEAVKSLIDVGATNKNRYWARSICTTRMIAGVGLPTIICNYGVC